MMGIAATVRVGFVALFSGVVALAQTAPAVDPPTTKPAHEAPLPTTRGPDVAVRIALVGDSTVNIDSGWGEGFAARLTGGAEAVNVARNGRSSKSYRDEGWWQKALATKPDYVLIQFGHNDQPGKGPTRETDPKTTFRENLTRYVVEARAIGARPVLITSIERRNFSADGKIKPSLADYADATRAVAEKEHVPLLDMHERSIERYEQMGEAAWRPLSPTKDGKVDTTHLNAEGSKVLGAAVADELAKRVPELAKYVK